MQGINIVKYSVFLAAGLAGCVPSPRGYESDPVVVQTDQGPVTCQLYTQEITVWDRSINRPDSMSVAQADQICLNEGKKNKTK